MFKQLLVTQQFLKAHSDDSQPALYKLNVEIEQKLQL